MLGNLSKVLIKAPSFFNNSIKNNNIKSLEKIPEENIVDPFYQINYIKKRGNSLNHIYFKEKEFWKKSFRLDMNFNNNKRISPKMNITLKKLKKLEYDRVLNNNYRKNINDDYIQKKNIFNLSSKNSRRRTPKESNNTFNTYKNIIFLNQNNNINEQNISSITNSDKNELFLDIEKNDIKRNTSMFINRYNNDEKYNINEDYDKEQKNEKNIFPKIKKAFKSQESLFQDNLDKKLDSLILLKPKIKEQYKLISRRMVGQRDFFLFQKSGGEGMRNPFYESIKKKKI